MFIVTPSAGKKEVAWRTVGGKENKLKPRGRRVCPFVGNPEKQGDAHETELA